MSNQDLVDVDELKEAFEVNIGWPKTLGWVKPFNLTDKSGVKFNGRLYWDANDGYSIYWDSERAPEMAHRPDFAYALDMYNIDPWYQEPSEIPQFGDPSDAGMDGA